MAWFPMTYAEYNFFFSNQNRFFFAFFHFIYIKKREFYELIPAFIDPNNFIEVLHSLLDLPLLVIAMERLHEKAISSMINEEISRNEESQSKYRVLYNHLLRNESGVTINFWESSTTMTLLRQFCNVIQMKKKKKNK